MATTQKQTVPGGQLRLFAPRSHVGPDRRTLTAPSIRTSPTSRAAGARIRVASSGARALQALLEAGSSGLTDLELQELLCLNGDTERPRRVTLVDRGLVIDSGRRRLTPTGRQSVVWISAANKVVELEAR